MRLCRVFPVIVVVVIFAEGSHSRDTGESQAALQRCWTSMLLTYGPAGTCRPITDEKLDRTIGYRIKIESWGGKKKEVDNDFYGAYSPPAGPGK